MSTSGETRSFDAADSDTGSGRLEVRCPICNLPVDVAVDTRLTDLTCSACGSHFSLVNQSDATRIAPPLATVGRFDLIERLGIGGFGAVWKARDKDLDRTVAIKIPRQGGMSAEETEKFFREARAAAQLRHPNIVSVHEVGRDGDSVFIVSDFVRGVTLGDWLTGQRLTSREAAELCAKIADALDHAHQQGVVHRDLKPSNIMIDGNGEPHLMDFGLARREVGEVTLTIDGQVLGTPAYMSPEQAQGEGHTANRRSDVYSLGVILFQLLTGELPFRGNARMIMHQVINDEPPSPRKLNACIPRDLETITLKCLEKDPNRRYQTARDFANELRRFLAGEPIRARPVSRMERAVQWTRRNSMVAALSSAAAMALVGGTVASTYFANHAHRQAMFALDRERDALAAKQESERARAEEARARREAEAVTDFLVYKDAGRLDEATPLFEETLRARLEKLGSDHADTLTAMTNLAVAYSNAKRFDHAIRLYEQISEAHRAKHGPNHPETLASTHALAHELMKAGRNADAIPLFESTHEARWRQQGTNNPRAIEWAQCLVTAYRGAGRVEDALALQEEIVTARREKLGADHPDTIAATNELAVVYQTAGRIADAIPLYQQTVGARLKNLGASHPETLTAMSLLARSMKNAGEMDTAIQLYQHTISTAEKVLGVDHADTLTYKYDLAVTFQNAGREGEAILHFEDVFDRRNKKFGADHPDTIRVARQLATSYRDDGRPDEAVGIYLDYRLYADALRLMSTENDELVDLVIQAALAEDGNKVKQAIDLLVLGELRLVAGEAASAEDAMRAAIAHSNSQLFMYKSLGWCLLAQGKTEDAREAFGRVLEPHRQDDGSYKLEGLDADERTVAYFLDLLPEQQYVEQYRTDKKFACFPWFYIGQRREIEGNQNAAMAAYTRCVEAGQGNTAHSVRALARWRLAKLREPGT